LYVAGDIKMKKSPTLFPEDPLFKSGDMEKK
jgi:hypothetical protein